MRQHLRVTMLLVSVIIFASLARAQTPPQRVPQSPPAPAQVPALLTLDDAHRIALQNHPRIAAAQASAAAASEQITEARSAYFPNLYGSITGVDSDSGSRISAGALNNPTVFDRFATGLTAEQLVTDFGRTQNLVASARLNAQAAQEGVNFSRADVLINVDRAFYGALRAQAVLRVAQETVRQRELVSEQITVFVQNKFKSGLDLSFANVNLGEAKLLLVRAQNDALASMALLSEALGLTKASQFDLVEPADAAPSLPGLDDALSAAARTRPELAGAKFEADSARRFAIAERDLSLPTISLAGVAGVAPYRQSPIPLDYAAAGFNVNIPIFNGKLFSARRAEADDRARQSSAELTDLQDRVARDVRLAWYSASTALQNVALTTQVLDNANEALELAQARYKLGLGNIVELSQAQLNQTQASIAQATAKYDYASQFSELLYQEGTLH
ncbi:MAG: TolC family protein [Candidatus Acidiferrales bacterium]